MFAVFCLSVHSRAVASTQKLISDNDLLKIEALLYGTARHCNSPSFAVEFLVLKK